MRKTGVLIQGQSQHNANEMVGVSKLASGLRISDTIQNIGFFMIQYGLALVIAWIGAMKFTAYEAHAIQPLVVNSPLLGWVYGLLSVQGFSYLLGTIEICIALLIAARFLSVKLTLIGSALAVGMFTTTLTFLFSTPGWEHSLGGFPALSALPGQFLIKDIVLLGAAIWLFGKSINQVSHNTRKAP
ncbi:MAG: DUF417 family protein [Deltaproteobacteria bacterium]